MAYGRTCDTNSRTLHLQCKCTLIPEPRACPMLIKKESKIISYRERDKLITGLNTKSFRIRNEDAIHACNILRSVLQFLFFLHKAYLLIRHIFKSTPSPGSGRDDNLRTVDI